MFWLIRLIRLRPGGNPRTGHTRVCDVVWALPNIWRNGHWIRERSDLRSATGTGANTGQCLRTLRAWRPEPSERMHACRVFVLHNMHTLLDFNSVDFLDILEGLGLLLIFMHRGIWRDFIWSYYCAFATVPLCLDDTVMICHIDCMMCWLYVYCFVGYGPCILRDLTNVLVKSMFCGNQSVGVYTLEFILTICIPYMIHGISY